MTNNRLKHPFYAFRFTLVSGDELLVPMFHFNSPYLNGNLDQLANLLTSAMQHRLVDEGKLDFLLREHTEEHFATLLVEVDFPVNTEDFPGSPHSVEFVCFYQQTSNSFWGVIPVLGIDVAASTLQELEKRLREAAKLEFIRNRSGRQLHSLIELLWYKSIRLDRKDLSLEVKSLQTLEDGSNHSKGLLTQAAPLLKVNTTVFERDRELWQLTRALENPFNKQVLIVGKSGVGKTALIEAYASKLSSSDSKLPVRETTAAALIRTLSTDDQGWQQGVVLLAREIEKKPCLLFVRSYAELFEVGTAEGNPVSLGEYIRPYMERGEMNIISECTPEQKAQLDLKHPGLIQLFQLIVLEEPARPSLELILQQYVSQEANKYDVEIDMDSIQFLLSLQKRFSPYAGFPGKTIRSVNNILTEISESETKLINQDNVVQLFCNESGMPPFLVDPKVPLDDHKVEQFFKQRVFGQHHVVSTLVGILAKIKTGLNRNKKPIASLLFAGPTGVGKTEIAKTLTELVFGDSDRMLRFDMSEFSTPWQVEMLIGNPYQPSKDGLLTAAVRRNPFAVVLFDEIEKADRSFLDLLLQILDEGRLTDSRGQLANFCGSIIIMTSNLGAQRLQMTPVKFDKKPVDPDVQASGFLKAVQQGLRPELYNRIDAVLPFHSLTRELIHDIVGRELEMLMQREGLYNRPLDITTAPEVRDFLSKEGFNLRYGARHLKRTIRLHLVIPLAEKLNEFDVKDKLSVNIFVRNNAIQIEVEEHPNAGDFLLEVYEHLSSADIVTGYRQLVFQFEYNPIYIELDARLQLLEVQKRQNLELFLKNPDKAKELYRLQELPNRLAVLQAEILQFEHALCNAYLMRKKAPAGTYELTSGWMERFRVFQTDLLVEVSPNEEHQCILIMASPMPYFFAQAYQKVFQQKEFETYIEQIWVLREPDKSNPDSYKLRPINEHKASLLVHSNDSPGEAYIFAGFKVKVRGTFAHQYLREEGGVHVLQTPQMPDVRMLVQVYENEDRLQELHNLIRMRSMSKIQERRALLPGGRFRETIGSHKHEGKYGDDYASWLKSRLDDRFEEQMERMMQA